MDYTNVRCMSHKCKDKDVIMNGAGGSVGGRISFAKLRCPECDTAVMIMPMSEKYEYSISATTEEDRIEARNKKAKEKRMLELAREIAEM